MFEMRLVGFILWNSDSQTFHKVLHIIRSFNFKEILSPALDREWGSASSVALEIQKKKSYEAVLGDQHQLSASPPVQTGKKQVSCF